MTTDLSHFGTLYLTLMQCARRERLGFADLATSPADDAGPSAPPVFERVDLRAIISCYEAALCRVWQDVYTGLFASAFTLEKGEEGGGTLVGVFN